MMTDRQEQELQQQRDRFANSAAQHVAQQATAERSFWSWLRRVPLKKEIVPPGGADNPEFLERVRPFMRLKETQAAFCARTGLGPYQVLQMQMTRAEIARFIELGHAADKESFVGPAEVFEPRPMPRKIILDVF